MNLRTEPYAPQAARWPEQGKHILSQSDAEHIVVYQAYRPEIAKYAVETGRFGGGFSFTRMSWIKPNFLWMMSRSGWASKDGQTHVLALTLPRVHFDSLLRDAVASSATAAPHLTADEWKEAVATSNVRLQWDPDNAPDGRPLARRALQLGLRGETLRRFGDEWLVSVEDVTAFVHEQRGNLDRLERLVTPAEDVYPVSDPGTRQRLGLTPE
ncbi:DUF4291 domain-containing protein [Deinococcus sp. KSM4-11]|uniref:DUF4291 domain-containing protein n=1 Tax=Deinococcus sp. KSM4-11 TaxID=2568654 RepID=UPI0010A3D7A5|nr:DUF4291 domain-containing protein [Deinococcus sp. KSM4-11]THF87714.1 DUF4291 domain-containing protein [Deinococcus sp. KSM4-11]